MKRWNWVCASLSSPLQISKNEAKGGVMRLVVAGGRARESSDYPGAVAVGVRTLSEGGAVGGFTREQVSCLLWSVCIVVYEQN